ncbi:MAG: type IX secretion system membrane protein PorP/SprF [Bacteroidia bacterium]|nr:type IX secretion system membrane protein PorP/SprF [Bacteroidia bacterium]
MKKLLGLFFFLCLQIVTNGQQLPLYSQYVLNGFLINPAIAGTENYSPIRLTVRQQWVGIKGAPATQALSAHRAITRHRSMGIGGYIFNDNYGPFTRTGLLAAYSYQLSFGYGGPKLSFGLSASTTQLKFDQSRLEMVEPDEDISGNTERKIAPDIGCGLYFYDKKYFAGISAAQLLQYKVDLGATGSVYNKLIRHYFATAGYKFALNSDFQLEPSLFIKATEKGTSQADINATAYYKKNYWLGFSYRSDKSLVVLVGFQIGTFYLCYAFDYTFSNLKNYTYGSHEVVLGLNVGISRGSTLF